MLAFRIDEHFQAISISLCIQKPFVHASQLGFHLLRTAQLAPGRADFRGQPHQFLIGMYKLQLVPRQPVRDS